jgi:hypothetical protein
MAICGPIANGWASCYPTAASRDSRALTMIYSGVLWTNEGITVAQKPGRIDHGWSITDSTAQEKFAEIGRISYSSFLLSILDLCCLPKMRSDTAVCFVVSAIIVVAIKQFSGLRWGEHYLALLLAGSLFFASYKTYIYPNFFSPLRHIPQPDGALPFIGHDLAAFQQPPAKDFGRWMREIENDGLVFSH